MKRQVELVFLSLGFFVLTSDQYVQRHLTEDRVQHQALQQERMSIQPVAKFKNFIKKHDAKEGIPHLLYGAGGLMDMSKIDYSAPPAVVFKNMADSLVPVIAIGLSVIPGGALIGGILSGVWSLVSPFFGGGSVQTGPSPLELMINDIREEMNNLRKSINELAEKIPEQMRKETDDKLKSLVSKVINSQINRNEYVCGKYSLVSKLFSDDVKNHVPINESLRIEMINQLHNCDNFLKDTATAFVYPEFAEVLWVPSVITTFVRVAFLAEVTNYGVALDLDEPMMTLFWSELKDDIKRHFAFAELEVQKRLETFMDPKRRSNLKNFTEIEYEGCMLQAQILYLDRQLYPYGVPDYFRIYDNTAELKIANFNVTKNKEPHHIQVYYNDIGKRHVGASATLLNCILGTEQLIRIPYKPIVFRVTYVLNKSYQIRVLYFTPIRIYIANARGDAVTTQESDEKTSDRFITAVEKQKNTLTIKIDTGKPNPDSVLRYLVKTAFHSAKCVGRNSQPKCGSDGYGFGGTFIVENVIAFNMKSGENPKGKIIVQERDDHMAIVFGIELIVLPLMV